MGNLRNISNGVQSHLSLALREQYQVDPSLIARHIPAKDLATVLLFAGQRKEFAQYKHASQVSPLSRHYNRNGGIVRGRVAKRARYLLHSDHYEADMFSCFQTIITAWKKMLFPLAGQIEDVIQFL